MLYALAPMFGDWSQRDRQKNKRRASPGAIGFCPICDELLIPKCGNINIWHWAHKSSDCDTWNEGETEWHLRWKEKAWLSSREVPITKGLKTHRADIFGESLGVVVELQNSPISSDTIKERETFYDKMVWIVNGIEFRQRFKVHIFITKTGNLEISYSWKHPRKSWTTATAPLFIDFGDKFYAKVTGLDQLVPSRSIWLGRSTTYWPIQDALFYVTSKDKYFDYGSGKIIDKSKVIAKYFN